MIRVLIVEDDPMVAEFNRRYVAQVPGFELVDIANNSCDALKIVANKKIDLLLLDIFMPGMNGLELLIEIRKLARSLDVIVVSAARDSHSIKTALRYGAIDYLIKPFEFERLRDALLLYCQRVSYIEKQELDQEELDQCILHKSKTLERELPKGLERNTLKKVWQEIRTTQGLFTTEQMSKQVGISRVSMRKYLEYLQKKEVLKLDICYGAIGRPTYKYYCINYERDIC